MRKLIILILCCLGGSPVLAVTVPHLYEAKVPVASRLTPDRQQAIEQALARVLIKVSGNSSIMALPAVQSQLVAMDSWVKQYSYQHTGDEQALSLHVSFLPQAIRQVLQQAKQGVWPKQRPLIVAWIATPLGELLGSDSEQPWVGYLLGDAKQRGLPLLLPMLDLDEREAVPYTTVSQKKFDVLKQASEKYGAQAILVLQLTQVAQAPYQATWSLQLKDETMSWTLQADSLNALMSQGVNTIAESLATRFAVLPQEDDAQLTALTVSDINSVADYAKVMQYLKGLGQVKSVQIVKVMPNAVEYAMQLRGKPESLVQALSLDNELVPAMGAVDKESPLHYRLTA